MNEPASIIPTANVIVSYSADAINRLFESGGSSKNLLHSIEEDSELLLFNKESNPNFISFDYSFGLGGGQHIATLKFLDPENEFESRFFTKGFVENVAGFKTENPDNALLSGEQGQRPATNRQTDVDSAVRNQFIERYKKAYGNKNLYIAFGSGFDTATWAGPYQMYMTGATIEGAKGKVITLQLTPTPKGLLKMDNRTATGDIVNLSMNGLYTRTTGQSGGVNIAFLGSPAAGGAGFDRVYEISPYPDRPGETLTSTAQANRGRVQDTFESESATNALAQKKFFKGSTAIQAMAEINYHDMIVDCIKDYIAKATGNPNVIVLLPNLNLLLLDFIQEEVNKLINAQAQSAAQTGSHATVAVSLPPPEVEESFKMYSYIREVMTSLGFDLVSKPAKGFDEKTDITNTSISRKVREAQNLNEAEQYARFLEYNEFNIALNTRSSDLFANHEETLIGVMDKLKAAMKGRYPLNPITFVENNQQWTRLWGAKPLYAKHRTFAGNGHARYNRSKGEAIIFGDLGLIKSYLYATKDLVKTAEDPLAISEITEANRKTTELQEQIEQLGLPDVSAVTAGDPAAVALSEQLGELKTLKEQARFNAINAFISFAGTNILGPLDRSILDEEYQKDARENILSKLETVNKTPFGNLYEVPEEFSIGVSQLDEDDSLAALQKASAENKFPIFKYNTSNPNVLQLKTDVSFSYYAAMQMGWQKALDRQAAGVVTGLLKSKHAILPVLTTEEAINFLFANNFADGNFDDKTALIRELEKRVSHSLVEDYNLKEAALANPSLGANLGVTVEPQTYDMQSIAAQIGLVAFEMEREGNSPVIMVDQEKPGDPTSIMAQLLTQAHRRAFNVTLKTTPLFHLSTVGKGMLSNCLLFAQDPPVIKTGTRSTQNFFNTFLSGMYQIVGFKHKIDATGEASSEFTLIGGPISATEKENV